MPAVAVHPVKQQKHPILIIRAAVRWALAAGHPVRLGSWGVHCVSSLQRDRWAIDPTATGIDPVGAAILHAQPEETEPYAAAAAALNAPEPWVHGFIDALEGEAQGRRWTESIHRAQYAAGFEGGTLYRDTYLRRARAAVVQ